MIRGILSSRKLKVTCNLNLISLLLNHHISSRNITGLLCDDNKHLNHVKPDPEQKQEYLNILIHPETHWGVEWENYHFWFSDYLSISFLQIWAYVCHGVCLGPPGCRYSVPNYQSCFPIRSYEIIHTEAKLDNDIC